ncbi:MAG: hypothetical protein U5R49_24615 [Deltaproteobacteria bacterium]|nr:hypothetical protein [Deltaproteobacteria bacterium]
MTSAGVYNPKSPDLTVQSAHCQFDSGPYQNIGQGARIYLERKEDSFLLFTADSVKFLIMNEEWCVAIKRLSIRTKPNMKLVRHREEFWL